MYDWICEESGIVSTIMQMIVILLALCYHFVSKFEAKKTASESVTEIRLTK